MYRPANRYFCRFNLIDSGKAFPRVPLLTSFCRIWMLSKDNIVYSTVKPFGHGQKGFMIDCVDATDESILNRNRNMYRPANRYFCRFNLIVYFILYSLYRMKHVTCSSVGLGMTSPGSLTSLSSSSMQGGLYDRFCRCDRWIDSCCYSQPEPEYVSTDESILSSIQCNRFRGSLPQTPSIKELLLI